MRSRSRVSVVTPFYNTEPYLRECIESVLEQSHSNFEYLLVNNLSDDGSREIAAEYAARDNRVRLIDNKEFVSQIDNFNGALRHVASDSKFVKLILADDKLLPGCLEAMVNLGDAEPNVGMVAAYYLEGDHVGGTGVPTSTTVMPGRDACRVMLLDERFPVGSPSTVMYRGDIMRSRTPFYPTGRYHEDTDAAYEILLDHDLGFVHQVLTFVRTDNVSITSSHSDFHPNLLDLYMAVERFGPEVLGPKEFRARSKEVQRTYYQYLGRALLRARRRDFWEYHRSGLATMDRDLDWARVVRSAAVEALRLGLNPEATLRSAANDILQRLKRRTPRVPMPSAKARRT